MNPFALNLLERKSVRRDVDATWRYRPPSADDAHSDRGELPPLPPPN